MAKDNVIDLKKTRTIYAVVDKTPRVYPWMNEHFQPFTQGFIF